MTNNWKAILFTTGLTVLLTTGVTLTVLMSDQRATALIEPGASQLAANANQAAPEHHTVTVHCPNSVSQCTGGRITIQTSDGGSSQQSFNMGGNTTANWTFSGLTGGGAALDLSNPQVYCLAGDSATIPMGPGASVTGGPPPGTFTVPAGIAATITIACQ